MRTNHSVRYLDFSENAIGGKYEKTSGGPATGGAAIALALGVNSTLRRIDLRWNLLGAKVGVEIVVLLGCWYVFVWSCCFVLCSV